MANRDIITRMSAVLDDYEAARVGPSDVERSIQFHIEALEALPYARVKEAGTLCHRLMSAHMSAGEKEFIGEEDIAKVLTDIRMFLALLPANDAG